MLSFSPLCVEDNLTNKDIKFIYEVQMIRVKNSRSNIQPKKKKKTVGVLIISA